MKKYLLLSLFAALVFTACKDEDLSPVLKVGSKPAFTSPAGGTALVLKEADQNNVLAVFSWTAADFGYDAAVSYSLELDKAGNNFAAPVAFATSNGLTVDNVTVGQMNNLLLTKGIPGEEATQVEIRIAATISTEVPTVYSDPITLTVTPYTVVINYPQLEVPGSYQSWSPDNAATVGKIFSAQSNSRYEGYVYFNADNTEFKYTQGGSWSINWGDDGADGILEPGGANLLAPTAGVYKLNVDLGPLSHSFVRTDWGLIGSATPDGWNSDQNMTYDDANKKWTITLNLVAGEIKFRANDGWDINFGDDNADKKMEYGGANIAIPSDGNYTIELLLGSAIYTYKVTKN